MLAGTLARDGAVGRTIEVPTPTSGQEAFLSELDALVERLLAEGAGAIGVGVPMNIDRRTGVALRAVNLPLGSLDLGRHLHGRFGIPVGIENDGNAIALAEWRLGAGRGVTDLVALALGTGVGGGIVLDGRLYRGWAELGHVVVDADGPPCQGNCHGRGHLEAVASGEAAERAARELWGDGADSHTLVKRGARRRRRRACRGGADRPLPGPGDRLVREHLRTRRRRRRRRLRDRSLGAAPRAGSRGRSARGAAAGRRGAPDRPGAARRRCRPGGRRARRASRRSTASGSVPLRGLRDADREPRGRHAPRARRAPRGGRRPLRGHAPHAGPPRPLRDPSTTARQRPPTQRGASGRRSSCRGSRRGRPTRSSPTRASPASTTRGAGSSRPRSPRGSRSRSFPARARSRRRS